MGEQIRMRLTGKMQESIRKDKLVVFPQLHTSLNKPRNTGSSFPTAVMAQNLSSLWSQSVQLTQNSITQDLLLSVYISSNVQEALKGKHNPMVSLLASVDMSLTEARISSVFLFEKIPP